MTHLLANIAWCSTGWIEPTLEGRNFDYVKRGRYPHEGYNFAFNHPRNEEWGESVPVIYGYVETDGKMPRQYADENNGDGICFFVSRSPRDRQLWVVGLYGYCMAIERDIGPWDEVLKDRMMTNLRAPRESAICFDERARVPFDAERYLYDQKQIGRANFANVGDPEAAEILRDAVAAHRRLPYADDDGPLRQKTEVLEALLSTVSRVPPPR